MALWIDIIIIMPPLTLEITCYIASFQRQHVIIICLHDLSSAMCFLISLSTDHADHKITQEINENLYFICFNWIFTRSIELNDRILWSSSKNPYYHYNDEFEEM